MLKKSEDDMNETEIETFKVLSINRTKLDSAMKDNKHKELKLKLSEKVMRKWKEH